MSAERRRLARLADVAEARLALARTKPDGATPARLAELAERARAARVAADTYHEPRPTGVTPAEPRTRRDLDG
jgi:hypothetical protein